jgi:hypothetical protein
MNTLQNDQKPRTGYRRDSAGRDLPVDLMKKAKPIGTFAGQKDFILRFRNGKLVPADTGDQGGGQN